MRARVSRGVRTAGTAACSFPKIKWARSSEGAAKRRPGRSPTSFSGFTTRRFRWFPQMVGRLWDLFLRSADEARRSDPIDRNFDEMGGAAPAQLPSWLRNAQRKTLLGSGDARPSPPSLAHSTTRSRTPSNAPRATSRTRRSTQRARHAPRYDRCALGRSSRGGPVFPSALLPRVFDRLVRLPTSLTSALVVRALPRRRHGALPAPAQVRALRVLLVLPAVRPRAAGDHHAERPVLLDPGQRRGRSRALRRDVQADRHAPPHPSELPRRHQPARSARVHPASPRRLPRAVRRLPRDLRVPPLRGRGPLPPHRRFRPLPRPRHQAPRRRRHQRRRHPRRHQSPRGEVRERPEEARAPRGHRRLVGALRSRSGDGVRMAQRAQARVSRATKGREAREGETRV